MGFEQYQGSGQYQMQVRGLLSVIGPFGFAYWPLSELDPCLPTETGRGGGVSFFRC